MADLLAPRSVWPVHRLDREAGGLMVFAKTARCAAALSAAMQAGAFEKEYLAVCEGAPPQEGQWSDLLYHDRGKNKTYVVARRRAGVKEARLAFCTLGRLPEGTTPVAVRLYTGLSLIHIWCALEVAGRALCGHRRGGGDPRCGDGHAGQQHYLCGGELF